MGLWNGPSINIPITSLQSNAFVVDHIIKCQPKSYASTTSPMSPINSTNDRKIKINKNVLCESLHRPDSILATIEAQSLWQDVDNTQCIDTMCRSLKIITTPSHCRGKTCTSTVLKLLDKISVDTVPNPESMCLSADTRFKYISYFVIVIPTLSNYVQHVCINAGSEFLSGTFWKWCSKNKANYTSAARKHQEQNSLVK